MFHRYRVLSVGARLCRAPFFIPLLFSAAVGPAVAATNSWTKPTSGYWEEQAYWSLGVLPDATQSVLFTNAGWKALAIGTATAQNFPQSMSVQSLQISSPADSYNTLLLNWSGFERPLRATSLSVWSNSSVVVHGSALEVVSTTTDGNTGNAWLQGTFIHADFSRVKLHGWLSVGRTLRYDVVSPAAYFFTNGTLIAKGLDIGSQGSGKIVQYGGFNNVGAVYVSGYWGGEYHLHGGQLTATNGITVGSGDYAGGASFYQYGGSLNADTVINGHYILNGGTITGRMSVPTTTEFQRTDGSVLQAGGTNVALSLNLGLIPNRFGGQAFYVLSNGVLQVDSSLTFRAGRFSQYNGLHTIRSNLVMGGRDLGFATATGDYSLAGGILSAGGLMAEAATFQQDGGTNFIAGDLVLTTLSLTFGRPPDPASYALSAGRLNVNNITISNGADFRHTGGVINHSNLLTLAGGHWQARPGQQALGRMRLASGNSSIDFPASASVLRLANSSGEPWSSSANLYINNWRGAASTAGQTQLFFGSNANGLTPQQLARIKFNRSGGVYSARILATGEVVPHRQLLAFSRSGNTLNLTWGTGWTLQSSTNAAGPYRDVQGAASPYSVSTDGPTQFFRLRQ